MYISFSDYAKDLIRDLMRRYEEDLEGLKSGLDDFDIPPPVSDTFEGKDEKNTVIEGYMSRFRQ